MEQVEIGMFKFLELNDRQQEWIIRKLAYDIYQKRDELERLQNWSEATCLVVTGGLSEDLVVSDAIIRPYAEEASGRRTEKEAQIGITTNRKAQFDWEQAEEILRRQNPEVELPFVLAMGVKPIRIYSIPEKVAITRFQCA